MELPNTDAQDKPAESQRKETRLYSIQRLAEKYPRLTFLYFFGFGIWTVLVYIVFLLFALGLLSDAIFDPLITAWMTCFRVLSIVLSLLALWGKFSRAKSRARNGNPVPAVQKASTFRPAERAIQRFARRHPRIASAHLYGYGISSVTLIICVFPPERLNMPYARFLFKTHYCFMLLSVPVAILAFCSLRKNKG